MITKNDIFAFLKNCGIKHDDKLTLHCSLRSIGNIENGADGFIVAFSEYLSDGLFIVPTHTWDSVCRSAPFYDVRSTIPCIGTLARVAAFRADGVRSLHPTHSVTVFGKNAAEWVKGEEHSASPAPVGGCLSRLYEESGKVLLIGVGHDKNTYLHAVDERLQIPDRLNPKPFTITIKDHEGNILVSPPFHTHFTAAADTCVSEYYPNYKEAFEYTGAVTYSQLGNALVYVCDARKMTDTAREIWAKADRDLCITHEPIPAEYYR
ncbi:MAG: AAC(3) family N-acetyltransferase [Ruminiclostridium sp.]|nr:AAC(3) family N-acetyltransferase [Ruminococcus sp.]MBP3856626.1 AAC(3) family N-acetyltransferase [Ruminiclostridium sp.]